MNGGNYNGHSGEIE